MVCGEIITLYCDCITITEAVSKARSPQSAIYCLFLHLTVFWRSYSTCLRFLPCCPVRCIFPTI